MSRRCIGEKLGDPDEIVGGGREGEDGLDLGSGADLDLGEPGLDLDPAEGLLDPLAAALADLVADMARRAAIDGGLANFPVFDTAPLIAMWGVTCRVRRSPTKASTS